MKSKLSLLLLAGILSISLAACSDTGVLSLAPSGSGTTSGANAAMDEEEYTPEIPEAVLNLSEEDDIQLNGELKDGVYVNNYFGLKFTAPEGMTLSRLNDDAAESTEIIPLKQTYEDGYGGLMITTDLSNPENVFITIKAAEEDEIGLTEEELVQAKIDQTRDLVSSFGLESGAEYCTAVLAGEEHPAHIDRSDPEEVTLFFHIINGDFIYQIMLTAPDEERIEYLASFFEKI